MAGSTFLILTNKVLRRLNEVELTSGTFASASGFTALAKDAVIDAIADIEQAEIEWPFNHTTGSITIVADGTTDYALATDAQSVDWNSFHMVEDVPTADVLEKYLPLLPYTEYLTQGYKARNANLTSDASGEPVLVIPSQDDKAIFFPGYADAAYQVDYEYWLYATEISAHGDTTNIPTRFDQVITQRALVDCYMFHDNKEQTDKAQAKFDAGLERMRTLLINKTERVYDTRTMRSDSQALRAG